MQKNKMKALFAFDSVATDKLKADNIGSHDIVVGYFLLGINL